MTGSNDAKSETVGKRIPTLTCLPSKERGGKKEEERERKKSPT
jgi:hypothetical protein